MGNSRSDVTSDMSVYKSLMQERGHLAPIVEKLTELESLEAQIRDTEVLLRSENDPEMIVLAKRNLQSFPKNVKLAMKK